MKPFERTGMKTNTFGVVVQEWLRRSFPSKPRFATTFKFKKDGEFEAVLRAPRGSRAGALVIFTFQGNLWVRFNPPGMCYDVDSRAELAAVIRQLVSDKALFLTTHRGSEWTSTTLLRRGSSPELKRGETARIISWSGRFDAQTDAAQPSEAMASDAGEGWPAAARGRAGSARPWLPRPSRAKRRR